MSKTERRKIFLYSAIFIALMVNAPQLFALRENRIFSFFPEFDASEFIFRVFYSFLFCVFFFDFNSRKLFYAKYPVIYRRLLGFIFNLVLLLIITRVGYRLNVALFDKPAGLLPGAGYGLRLLVSAVLMTIEFKILGLLTANREKQLENEYLRNAYLKAELEALKGQLNPHFFFNALSSLSGVVREDPEKAQHYIGQLSKFFRYTLKKANGGLVSLHEELNLVKSYFDILLMRHEKAIKLDIHIEKMQEKMLIPHMSLQPIIENAVKHNRGNLAKPLVVNITINGKNELVISNKLQLKPQLEPGNGIGLANLNERYKILTGKEIGIYKTETEFTVKLPLNDDAA